jgi:acyl-CoA dehydrogenase
MEFEHSEKVRALQARVEAFMADQIYPNEEELFAQLCEGGRWQPVPLLETLKSKARTAKLWNLFLPESEYGAGLTNLEYAPLCEIMGRSPWAPEVFMLGARHRKYGSAGALRHPGAAPTGSIPCLLVTSARLSR